MIKVATIISILACVYASPASCHDYWQDGTPVPPFVKGHCCGVADIHRYTADEVTQDANGDWHIPGYPKPIPDNGDNVYASGDGYYYAFFSQDSEGPTTSYGMVWCFFKPLSG